MSFEGPIFLDLRVAEVYHLLKHCAHECGPQFPGVRRHLLPCDRVVEVLSIAGVVVEGRDTVQEGTTSLHVPVTIIRYLPIQNAYLMILTITVEPLIKNSPKIQAQQKTWTHFEVPLYITIIYI